MALRHHLFSEATRAFGRLAGIAENVACRCLLAAVVVGWAVQPAAADANHIENLTFFDRSPGSPRANPYESVLRLDANDTSFAAAAGWGGGFNSWQQQFDHTKALAASHPYSGLVFVGDKTSSSTMTGSYPCGSIAD